MDGTEVLNLLMGSDDGQRIQFSALQVKVNEFKPSHISGALMYDVDEGTNEIPIVATIGVGQSQARERARMGWKGEGRSILRLNWRRIRATGWI